MHFAFIVLLVITVVLSALLLRARRRASRLEREHFVRSYVFSSDLLLRLKKHHPQLEERDIFLVARALREYFLIHIRAKGQFIGMPSLVVDDLWHEFILDTRSYKLFCKEAFAGYFHHIPASATSKGMGINIALRVTWKYACLEENINPNNPIRLPLLFAIDEKLQIENGNTYKLKTPFSSVGDSRGCGGVACGGGCGGGGLGCGDAGSCGDGGGCSGGCGGGCGGD